LIRRETGRAGGSAAIHQQKNEIKYSYNCVQVSVVSDTKLKRVFIVGHIFLAKTFGSSLETETAFGVWVLFYVCVCEQRQ
jgi:hypothetical protein